MTDKNTQILNVSGMSTGSALIHGDGNVQVVSTVHNYGPVQPIKTLPPCERPATNYTGREKFFKELAKAFEHLENVNKSSSDPLKKLIVISGLGGIGKSSAARRYAELSKGFHKNFAWINAEMRDSAAASFLELARHFKIPIQKESGLSASDLRHLVDQVYRHFSNHVQHGLFIFDNAMSMQAEPIEGGFGLQEFFPRDALEHLPAFLLTSRNQSWNLPHPVIQIWPLECLTAEETFEYFVKALKLRGTNSESEEKLKKCIGQLGHLLGGYPLAMTLASAVIYAGAELQCECSQWGKRPDDVIHEIEQYIHRFQHNGQDWLKDRLPSNTYNDGDYGHVMGTVWRDSVDKIKSGSDEYSQMALKLLQLIAYLPPDDLTVAGCHFIYYKQKMTAKSIKQFEKDMRTSKVRRALGILAKLSMITIVVDERDAAARYSAPSSSLIVHRLVQKWMRESLKFDQNYECLIELAVHFCETMFKSDRMYRPGRLMATICGHLKDVNWPDGIYRECLILKGESCTTNLGYFYFLDYPILKEIHNFLTTDGDLCAKDDEFLFLCRITMLLEHCNQYLYEKKNSGVGYGMVDITNKIFPPSDNLHGLNNHPPNLLDWILEHALLYKDNRVLQWVVIHLFLRWREVWRPWNEWCEGKKDQLAEWNRTCRRLHSNHRGTHYGVNVLRVARWLKDYRSNESLFNYDKLHVDLSDLSRSFLDVDEWVTNICENMDALPTIQYDDLESYLRQLCLTSPTKYKMVHRFLMTWAGNVVTHWGSFRKSIQDDRTEEIWKQFLTLGGAKLFAKWVVQLTPDPLKERHWPPRFLYESLTTLCFLTLSDDCSKIIAGCEQLMDALHKVVESALGKEGLLKKPPPNSNNDLDSDRDLLPICVVTALHVYFRIAGLFAGRANDESPCPRNFEHSPALKIDSDAQNLILNMLERSTALSNRYEYVKHVYLFCLDRFIAAAQTHNGNQKSSQSISADSGHQQHGTPLVAGGHGHDDSCLTLNLSCGGAAEGGNGIDELLKFAEKIHHLITSKWD